jgi:hypothetical protein
MAEKGWVSKWAFQDDALSADDLGRAAMADGFIQNAKLDTGAVGATDKVADGIITAAKFTSQANNCAWYGYNTYGDAVYG